MTKTNFIISALIIATLLGCSDAQQNKASPASFPTRLSGDDGTLASLAVLTVSGEQQSLQRVTESTFRMSPSAATLCMFDPTGNPPHAGYHCHVFVNDIAVGPMKSGRGEYKTGSMIVKQKYSSKLGENTELFTIMRKMENGYDSDHGNWEYSVVDSSGTNLELRGREESCISCHAYYPATDYVSRAYLEN